MDCSLLRPVRLAKVLVLIFILHLVPFQKSHALDISTKQGQIAALQSFIMEVSTHYGMSKFKEKTYGLTLENAHEKYKKLIEEARTLDEELGFQKPQTRDVLSIEEFRQLMVALAADFRDGHFNILRQSSHVWTLGIYVAEIDGKLFVTGLSPLFYARGNAGTELKVGDEITELNGVPVQKLAEEQMPYVALATYPSRFARALESLVESSHRKLMAKQTGDAVTLTFSRPGTDITKPPKKFTAHLNWIDTQAYFDVSGYFPPEKQKSKKDKEYRYGYRDTKSYFLEGLKKMNLPSGSLVDVGFLLNSKIQAAARAKTEVEIKNKSNAAEDLPLESPLSPEFSDSTEKAALADLKTVTRLSAYTIQHQGKNLGIIRIPDYSPATFAEVDAELKWLGHIVAGFENTVDGVIIDQLANGGGYVYYGTQFVRLFASDSPLKGVTIDLRLNETLLSQLTAWAKNNSESDEELSSSTDKEDWEPKERNFAELFLSKHRIQELRKKFENGERWSGPISYMSTQSASYSPEQYGLIIGKEGKSFSKPVMILNDCRSASCGDFMPSLMQANRRAIIYGSTSMGLGGPVYRNIERMPGSEMFIRCTFGFCERPDGLPIENLGVIPNVERPIARSDLMDGFKTYSEDALQTMIQYVDGKSALSLNQNFETKRINTQSKKEAFQELQSLLNAIKDPRHYEELPELLSELDLKELTKDDFSKLVFPMPSLLLEKDVILAGMNSRHAIAERLEELKGQESFRQDPKLLEMIGNIEKALQHLPNFRVINCQQALLSHVVKTIRK